MAKKKKEIRDMSKDQLIDHIEVLKKELFNLKIEIMSGQNNNTSKISKIGSPKFEMAGKTGTVQVVRISEAEREKGIIKNIDRDWKKRDHALFVGYAPIKNPRYAISVVAEHGGSGSTMAAPIARDICKELVKKI